MNKIVLSVNESRIEVAACENAMYLAQCLYGALKEINCAPSSIQELQRIISHHDVSDYIKSRIIKQKESEQQLEVMGMPINPEKLKELIAVPHISGIISLINEFDNETTEAFRYLILSDGIFSLVQDYDKDIREKHTVYTENDRQTDTAKKLIALRDAINDWFESIGVTDNNSLSDIQGLHIGCGKNGRYSLDIRYIKHL